VPAVPVAVSALVSLAGLFGLLLVLLRALDLPDWAGGRKWGLWLALASAAGIIAGALLAMREEMRPAGTHLSIEELPAPRP
jgi:formate hydrogenlyase subunit 3/multisubunit Na+/H+ antiporter MnhD subunit